MNVQPSVNRGFCFGLALALIWISAWGLLEQLQQLEHNPLDLLHNWADDLTCVVSVSLPSTPKTIP